MKTHDDGQAALDEAFEELEKELPGRLARILRWLRDPKSRKLRIPVAILFLLGGCLWFLPVLGIWMLPLGVMLIAQDIRFLRKPVGSAILWMVAKGRRLIRWWHHRKALRRA
jgi:hypothetical protein